MGDEDYNNNDTIHNINKNAQNTYLKNKLLKMWNSYARNYIT